MNAAPQPRALIVDDEPDLRELVGITLARIGVATVEAHDLAAARRLLEQGGIDLCLTDMRLPDGDGLELVAWMQRHAPAVPVAVITAQGSVEAAVQALKSGAFDFVAKPLELAQLRAMVQTALKLAPGRALAPSAVRLTGDSAPMREVRALQWSTGRWGVSRDYVNRGDAVEVKIGQGAKPGMGGHLLGAKVTADVSKVRGVPVGSDALSPCRYYDLQTLDDMKHMVAFLRDVTDYRVPILFKLGPSRPYADVAACIEAGAYAISIDGMVGGTGCSPDIVTQGVGIPTIACIPPAVQALKDYGVHHKVKLIAWAASATGWMPSSAWRWAPTR